jgi:hypothetical protein
MPYRSSTLRIVAPIVVLSMAIKNSLISETTERLYHHTTNIRKETR